MPSATVGSPICSCQVDESLLPGLVSLAQHDVEFLAPALIELANPAVAITVLVGVTILFPDQLQGHAAVTQQLLGRVSHPRRCRYLWPAPVTMYATADGLMRLATIC